MGMDGGCLGSDNLESERLKVALTCLSLALLTGNRRQLPWFHDADRTRNHTLETRLC